MKLDEKVRCPNCLRKPLTYRRERHFFCAPCCRQYSMDTGEQQENWAWRLVDGKWQTTYPDDGKPDHYGRAKPTAAALRKAKISP